MARRAYHHCPRPEAKKTKKFNHKHPRKANGRFKKKR